MIVRLFRNFAFLAFTALALQAQTSQISGPVSGYVFDGSARALRPILAIPGASLLGGPVNFGFDLTSACVAPRQDAAFVIAADQSVHLFRIDSGAVTERPVDSLA